MMIIRFLVRLLDRVVDHLIDALFGPLNSPTARTIEIAQLRARQHQLRTELVALSADALEQRSVQEHWAAWTREMTLR